MAKKKHTTIQKHLLSLCKRAEKKDPISIREILHIFSGKGRSLILVFLSLPFCQPFQIPGLSILFGLAIAFLGLRMSFGKTIWLPKFLLKKQIASSKVKKIARLGLKIINKPKFFLRPRMDWVCHSSKMSIITGIVVCFFGILLALPLPIPLTNLIAAWGILLIALGTLENDGVIVLAGYAILLLTIAFLAGIFLFFKNLVTHSPLK